MDAVLVPSSWRVKRAAGSRAGAATGGPETAYLRPPLLIGRAGEYPRYETLDTMIDLGCDKLGLSVTTPKGPDLLKLIPEVHLYEPRIGKRRGSYTETSHGAKVAGWAGETIFVRHRSWDGLVGKTLEVEFNPDKQGPMGMAFVRRILAGAEADPLRAQVIRLDVRFDVRGVEREFFCLDTGGHRWQPYGHTPRGFQTEGCGSREAGAEVVLYDKRAEVLERRGASDGPELPPWTRFEVKRFRGFRMPGVPEPLKELRLADLGRIEYPGLPGVVWRRLRVPEELEVFADPVVEAIGLVARFQGVKRARALGRKFARLSGVNEWKGWREETTEASLWPEVTERPEAAFARAWPGVASVVIAGVTGQEVEP